MSFVIRTFPIHLSENVPLDMKIDIFFMFDLNTETITPNNVILFNMAEQKSEPIEFEYKNRCLSIRPKQLYSPLTHYQVELLGGKTGIRDITGRDLGQSYKLEFYTADQTKIKTPTLTSPTDLSEIHGDVKFSWLAVENAYFYELQISKSNTFDVLEWPVKDHRVFGTEVIPDVSYKKGTYYARIRAVKDDGTASAFSKPIRYYYDGPNEVPEEPIVETITLPFVQTLQAKGGEMLFQLEKEYKVGTGQLSVYVNGMKVQATSGPYEKDGEYREIDSKTIMFLEPLTEGDALEFRIEGVIKEDVKVYGEKADSSEIVALRNFFAAQFENVSNALQVVSVTPSDGSVNIPVNQLKAFIIEFSEEIDPNSVNSTTFYVVSEKN
jgi:hypothetical protein